MKRIISVLFAVLMTACGTITAFAASPEIAYESSYDADSGLVTVSVFVKNPIGVQDGDLAVGFDDKMFEFKDVSENTEGGFIVAAGLAKTDSKLVTCSFMFAEACEASNCDSDGNLQLASYTFKPLTEDYDINDFYLWANTFDVNDNEIAKEMNTQGNVAHSAEHQDSVVTYASTTKAAADNNNNDSKDSSASSSKSSKWLVYVIFGVVAVGAIVGITLIVVKNNHKDEDEDELEEAEDSSVKAENEKSDINEDKDKDKDE